MRTYLDCVPCFVRQTIDAARRVTNDPEVHERLLRETLSVAAGMAFDQSPPEMGRMIHTRLRELTGQSDPYHSAKQQANAYALQLFPELKRKVEQAPDPFTCAVKMAIAGNVIDLGVKSSLTEAEIQSAINHAIDGAVDNQEVETLRTAISEARDILYLTDNAGEIVFDRLLIERLPLKKVTVAVKGSPIINDATREDAEAAGLTRMVRVIDNGGDVPGTILNLCSAEFHQRFEQADLIIAKGQGNYETLSECQHQNLFFLVKVKCAVLARDLKSQTGEMVVRKHRMMPQGNMSTPSEKFDWLAEEAHS